jgi:DNA-binding CsgD family transcriptional regulator
VVQGFLGGRFDVIIQATEGLELAREAGLPNAELLYMASLTWLAAVRGGTSDLRDEAARMSATARRNGHALAWSIVEWAVALHDLVDGRLAESAARLEALRTAPAGSRHPFYVISSAPDLVEASVRNGDVATASTAYAALHEFAMAPGAPEWSLALAARCRALLGGPADADTGYSEAILLHEGGNEFDLARTKLLLGEHLRRERRASDARTPLRSALEGFERLGATPWARRAGDELRATGETIRRRDASPTDELTPQERQVAQLVSEGLANKEIAARLFLSPRTVEYHLRKVVQKLGITSRADLIRDPVRGG